MKNTVRPILVSRLALALGGVMLAAACGQKGDLVLPPQTPQPSTPSPTSAAKSLPSAASASAPTPASSAPR